MSGALALADAHPDELKSRLGTAPALLLPLGTIEFHGDHLPLGLDGTKAERIARAAADRLGAVVAPTSWWAADGVAGPFTLRLPRGLVEALLTEALTQFGRLGFRVIAIVNGHYGLRNSLATRRAALATMAASAVTVLTIADYEVLLSLGAEGDHAGIFETSLLAAARPELVRLDVAAPDEPLRGVIGADPRGTASARLGRQALDVAAGAIASAVADALLYTPARRDAYIAALTAGAQALETIDGLRRERGRAGAPGVQTPSWLAHLSAIHSGRYAEALGYAEAKRARPYE
jgi:creatinine amidohydrolase